VKVRDVQTKEEAASRGIYDPNREMPKVINKDGVQREWYKNGILKSEAPYVDGVRHGLFKNWDEKGNLVGQYQFVNGTGAVEIYYSNGYLNEYEEYKNNLKDGLQLELYDNGQVMSLNWQKKGEYFRDGFAFHKNGKLRSWGIFNKKGKLHGPIVYFDANGKNTEISYCFDGQKIDEQAYKNKVSEDATLIYFSDPQQYQSLITDEVRAVVEKYKNITPVKIPLVLDPNEVKL
jgi:antitoxin component YwqK of YwqJK toxin-antitoxin module